MCNERGLRSFFCLEVVLNTLVDILHNVPYFRVLAYVEAMPVVACLASPQFDPSPMSSVPLPDAAQLQKPQDYKETFKVSLFAHLRMENVFDKFSRNAQPFPSMRIHANWPRRNHSSV